MAKNVITLTVTLNKEQAQRQIDEMKVSLKGMKDELSVVQNKLNDRDLWGPKDTFEGLKAREKALTKEIKLTEKAVTNGVREIEGYENKLAHLSELNYNTLTQMRTAYTNSLKNIKKETQEELEVYNEKAKELQSIRDEIAKRDIDVRGGMTEQKAKEVVASPKDYSQSELQDAIKVMEKLRDMQVMGSKQWKEYATQVENASKVLDAFKDKVKLDAMTAQFKDLGNISEKALSDQKKYWQEMVAGAANGSKELEQYEKNLAKVVAEEQKRTKEQAGKVMNNLTDYSVTEIKEAIKATEQLRDAQKPGSKAWAEYAAQVKNASDYLDSFKNKAQLEAMNAQFKNLGKLSADALAEQKKYWQSMVNGAANGSKELEQYRKILAQVTEEERKRSAASVKNVMSNPAKYSVNEIKESIKVTEQLRDAQQPGSKQWKEYATQVENANKVLKNFNDSAKMEHMLGQLSNVGKLSKSALVEQKKFWQEMVDGAEKGSNELKKYEQSLDLIKKEERKRISEEGSKVTNKVISGNWSGTVGEAKEAIELLKQFKETLDTADTKGIERVENAIDQLNKKTEASTEKIVENRKKTKKATQEVTSEWEELMSYEKAFETAQSVQDGIFDGTEKEIKAAIRALKEYKKNLRFESDKESIEDTVKALRVLERQAKTSSGSVRLIGQVLADLPHASMEELEWAAEELKKELHGATRHLGDYNTKAARLRQVNLELERAKKEWKGQESAITRVVKRLTAYVAVYGSYNFISSKIKEAIKWNLELSDSIADIQKTTGLSAESVANLSNQINAIDTRTAQKELHDLAYEAGKLGISAEEDVLAFVRAGNQLLVALGEDLGGAEAVRQLMKVNAILGETQELGVEKALLATGSAINEISQTTRASAGPIADMVKRIGAIGAAANLGMADLVALAGTADAAGQSAEVSATAFNKFIATLSSNPVDVAYALGLDPSRIKSLMESGNTIQAIIEIFEKMNLKGDMADLSPLMKDLGSEGARMTQVLTTMAGQVDELKAQVFTSNKAFEEATSVTNEYNIKNESAAAIAQRFGNSIREYFVNSGFVDWLKEVLQWMYYLPNVLERNRVLLFGLRLIIGEIFALSIGIWLNNVAKSLNRLTVSLGFSSEAWTKTYMQVAKHTLAIQAEAGAEAMATKKALLHASALKKLQIAFVTLGKVMLKNPIFIIGTVVAATYATIRIFTDDTNKAAKAVAEFNATVSKEQFELANLRTQIKLANQANGERAALIQKLNSKYGQYLGFLVTEENYIRNQEYIYKLLNKQIERSVALKMQEKLSSDIASKYADKQKSSYEDLLVILNSTKGIGETGSKSAMSQLMESIKEQAVNGTEDITTILHGLLQKTSETYQKNLESLNERVEKGELEVGSKGYKALLNAFQNADLGASYHDLRSAIKTILDTETAIASEAATAAELSAHNIKSIEKSITSIKRDEAVRVLDLVDTTTGTKELQEYESKLKNATSGRLADIQGIIDKQRESNKLTEEEQTLFESVNQKIRSGAQLTDEESSKYNNLLSLKEETLGLTKEEALALQTVNYEVLKYSKGLDTVQGKLAAAGKLNLWGDGKTIKDADVNQLVSMYERLESDAAKLAKGATSSIQTQYWKGFKDQKKAIAYYRSEAKKIKEELDERGFNTSGHFKWGSDRENSPEQIYRGWLAALEAYYNERETIIRQRGMEQNKLESEIARELEDLNAEKLASQRELEEGLLNDLYKGSTFDPKKFKGVITGTDYFANLTLESMRSIVSAGGPKLDAVIRKNLTDRMVKLEEQAYKIKQRIEKILLEDDFSEQVAQQYLNSLDQLGLLFNIQTEAMSDHSEEEGERRLAYMREWSKESYSLTAKDLQDKMEANAIFGDWVKNRTAEDYEALLILLRKLHDDQEEAERKAAERRKKIFNRQWEVSGNKRASDIGVEKEEADLKAYERFNELGLVSDYSVDEAQIELYRAKIKASQDYIEQIKKEMEQEILLAKFRMEDAQAVLAEIQEKGLADGEAKAAALQAEQEYQSLIRQQKQMTLDSENNIAEQRQLIAEKEMDIEKRNMDAMQQYADTLSDFAQQMGEAAWGSVEDRQEAGKALLANVLKISKDLLQTYLIEVSTRKMMNDVEIANERYKQAQLQMIRVQSLASTGATMIGEMEAGAALSAAQIELNSAEAASKEAAKKGWIGLAIGAAISVALSALLGAALGRINKAKGEVAAATGASTGRLATGMLTYAEGNYPVLGNDGQVYNAKYEGAGMKTGIYGGGAHFGIFSEKKPEAIIDGDTTQRLILNHPDIWQSIVTLSKTGRLDRGMRTFASGNINELARTAQEADATATAQNNEQMLQMQVTMAATQAAVMQLTQVLNQGIHAKIDMYGDGGMYKSMKKAESFASKRGYR